MPNNLAYLALLAWPLVAVLLFVALPPARAFLATLFGGYLLLPPVAALDVPGLPPIDKTAIIGVSVCLGCLLAQGGLQLLPKGRLAAVLVILFVFVPVGSVLTNSEPIFFRVGGLPGLGLADAVHGVAGQLFAILPFLVARQLLATPAALRMLLVAFVLAGIAYSAPMLIEMRLSPQINVWVYGFFQHSFDQMMRYGGYRPIVFLQHGLWVALFTVMAVLSAGILWASSAGAAKGRWFVAIGYLSVILVLCKSAAALVYGLLALPLALWGRIRLQLAVAMALVTIAMAYPLLRGSDIVPIGEVVTFAESLDAERAQSLEFRLDNEEALLERARLKPLFGWGLWGRNQIHDFETGRLISVTDGRWIIVIGSTGWIGFVVEFGLLALPIVLLWRQRRRLPPEAAPIASGTALILAINLADMLPNATLTPLTWMLAGALLGFAEARVPDEAAAPGTAEATPPPSPRRTII